MKYWVMILKDKTINYFIGIFVIYSSFFLTVSCDKEPESVGGELFQKEELNIGLDTTNFISAYSLRIDSIYTKNKTIYPLGTIYDAVFGQVSSSVYYEMHPSNLLPESFYTSKNVDSVVMELNVKNAYGDINTYQNLHVFRLANFILSGKDYYSTSKIPLDLQKGELGSIMYSNRSLIEQIQANEVAKLRIPLSNELMGDFILGMNKETLENDSLFKIAFKGLAIIPEPLQAAGYGSMAFANFSNLAPKITIYYNDTSTYTCKFISGSCNVFGNYEHNFLASEDPIFKQQIIDGDTTLGVSNIYLEGLSGSHSVIKFSGLKNWVNDRKLFIHQAKLILPVEVSENGSFIPPSKLKLQMRTDTTLISLPDEKKGVLIGGTYSRLHENYDYLITMYIQDLVNGETDHGLELSFDGVTFSPDRVKFFGTDPELERNIRLKIIYTELE